MNSLVTQSKIAKQQKAVVREISRLRDELEDLGDTLDLLEARARNLGKPTYSLEEARKKLGLKS
jgi:cell division protein FtsB